MDSGQNSGQQAHNRLVWRVARPYASLHRKPGARVLGERMVDQMDAKRAAGDDCLIAKTYPCEEGAGMERAAAACRANDVPLNAGAVPCLPYLSATAARGIVLYLVPIVPFA